MKTIKKSDFFMVALGAILIEEGFNPRMELTKLDELAKSIATIGQKTPIEGFPVRGKDQFILTAGHRRMAAIAIANKKYIGKEGYLQEPITHVNVFKGAKDDKTRLLTALLDGQTEKLTNAELIGGCARLKAMGMSPKEIGQSIGKSQAQVYNLIAVANAPQAIQDLVRDNLISVALVNQIQREAKGNEEKQIEMAQEAVGNAQEEPTAAPATGGGTKAPAKAPAKPKKATAKNASTKKKVSADVAKLEAALALADENSAKGSLVKVLINKLKNKASTPADIAKLLK
jgi:ParB/RepB/Spo0J family partition protein